MHRNKVIAIIKLYSPVRECGETGLIDIWSPVNIKGKFRLGLYTGIYTGKPRQVLRTLCDWMRTEVEDIENEIV